MPHSRLRGHKCYSTKQGGGEQPAHSYERRRRRRCVSATTGINSSTIKRQNSGKASSRMRGKSVNPKKNTTNPKTYGINRWAAVGLDGWYLRDCMRGDTARNGGTAASRHRYSFTDTGFGAHISQFPVEKRDENPPFGALRANFLNLGPLGLSLARRPAPRLPSCAYSSSTTNAASG